MSLVSSYNDMSARKDIRYIKLLQFQEHHAWSIYDLNGLLNMLWFGSMGQRSSSEIRRSLQMDKCSACCLPLPYRMSWKVNALDFGGQRLPKWIVTLSLWHLGLFLFYVLHISIFSDRSIWKQIMDASLLFPLLQPRRQE